MLFSYVFEGLDQIERSLQEGDVFIGIEAKTLLVASACFWVSLKQRKKIYADLLVNCILDKAINNLDDNVHIALEVHKVLLNSGVVRLLLCKVLLRIN